MSARTNGQNLERFQKLPHERTLPSDTHTLYYLTRLSDDRLVSHEKLLPSDLYTLYHLTRLDNTEWRQLIDMLPFSIRWAQMLVRISTDLRLTKHASFLPSDCIAKGIYEQCPSFS